MLASDAASEKHCRDWALLWNFAPLHPAVATAHQVFQSSAERLNKHRYSRRSWLEHLLVSSRCLAMATVSANPMIRDGQSIPNPVAFVL